ncbi:hypothetical protein N7447_011230 [Penicillium robsamsonii]|uniref:uncharacterized protein n=1 Tax=Penicillium robsamsonii TaxID=1792511 RepID=UPI0025473938|nr:uncharacterized protein N7447_011230 [Penicillium robsamsonii]KAJ5807318.1 hypothetical protein N7447_011230 [Penicillium robsamsonii]
MVAAPRRTSALGEIDHRSGALGTQQRPMPLYYPPRVVLLRRRPALIYWGPSPRWALVYPLWYQLRGPLAPGTVGVCGSDGRWPYLKLRLLREPPCGIRSPAFRGLTLHPRATCCSLPAFSRAPGRITCVRTGAEEFSGGNWMVSASPSRRGCCRNRAPVRPFHLTTPTPRGSGLPGLSRRKAGGPRDVLP